LLIKSPYKIYLETGYLIENFINDWYSTTNMLEVSTLGDSLKCSFLQGIVFYLFVYYFVLDRPQFALMKLSNIRVLLNRANCWNFWIDKRNLDIAVSASSNRLFFYDLMIIILLGAKLITIINVVHFLKKRCSAAFSIRNLIVFT